MSALVKVLLVMCATWCGTLGVAACAAAAYCILSDDTMPCFGTDGRLMMIVGSICAALGILMIYLMFCRRGKRRDAYLYSAPPTVIA